MNIKAVFFSNCTFITWTWILFAKSSLNGIYTIPVLFQVNWSLKLTQSFFLHYLYRCLSSFSTDINAIKKYLISNLGDAKFCFGFSIKFYFYLNICYLAYSINRKYLNCIQSSFFYQFFKELSIIANSIDPFKLYIFVYVFFPKWECQYSSKSKSLISKSHCSGKILVFYFRNFSWLSLLISRSKKRIFFIFLFSCPNQIQ